MGAQRVTSIILFYDLTFQATILMARKRWKMAMEYEVAMILLHSLSKHPNVKPSQQIRRCMNDCGRKDRTGLHNMAHQLYPIYDRSQGRS